MGRIGTATSAIRLSSAATMSPRKPRAAAPLRRMPETKKATQAAGEAFLMITETVGGMGVLAGRIVARLATLNVDGA